MPTPTSNAATGPINIEIVVPDGTRRAISGAFVKFNGQLLVVSTTERISSPMVAAVQYGGLLFLGEVLACFSGTGACWAVRIKVKYTLTGLQSLARLRRAVIGKPV